MLERLYSFLVVLPLMFSGEIFGQFGEFKNYPASSISTKYKKNTVLKSNQYQLVPGIIITDKKKEKYVNFKSASMLFSTPTYLSIISPSLYKDELGLVCKREWELEKLTTVPFRFRLGSLDYVNYLEQKPNAIKPLQ